MMLKIIKKQLSVYCLLVLWLSLFLIAGWGEWLFSVKLTGLLVSLVVLIAIGGEKQSIKLPRFFSAYGLFLLIWAFNLFWSVNRAKTFEEWCLFSTGGLWWLIVFNRKNFFKKYLDKLIVLLGLIFGGLFLYYYLTNQTVVKPWSLIQVYSGNSDHFMVGDFWSMVMGIALANQWWLLMPVGIFLIILSQSRAAVVALVAGIYYLFKDKIWLAKWRNWLVMGLVLVFLGMGINKTVLNSRHYYVQSLVGLKYYPWGVGVGNFNIISRDKRTHLWGLSSYATNVHSIVLEMMSGLGWLGLVFVFWLFQVFKAVWQEKDNLVYRITWIVLTVDFLLFSGYLVPTMLWLWFMLLGLIL